jgi:hypothetical protein
MAPVVGDNAGLKIRRYGWEIPRTIYRSDMGAAVLRPYTGNE